MDSYRRMLTNSTALVQQSMRIQRRPSFSTAMLMTIVLREAHHSGECGCSTMVVSVGSVRSERRKKVTTAVAMAVSIQANDRVAPIASKGFAANIRAIMLISSKTPKTVSISAPHLRACLQSF